jgi:hypothetical protein
VIMQWASDFRHAWRGLLRTPAFSSPPSSHSHWPSVRSSGSSVSWGSMCCVGALSRTTRQSRRTATSSSAVRPRHGCGPTRTPWAADPSCRANYAMVQFRRCFVPFRDDPGRRARAAVRAAHTDQNLIVPPLGQNRIWMPQERSRRMDEVVSKIVPDTQPVTPFGPSTYLPASYV